MQIRTLKWSHTFGLTWTFNEAAIDLFHQADRMNNQKFVAATDRVDFDDHDGVGVYFL